MATALAPQIVRPSKTDAGFVTIRRVSNNPQKVKFGDSYLCSSHYRDQNGDLQRATFINGKEKETPLVINNNGQITLYKNKFPDSHNIESLKKLLAATPSPFPADFGIELIDHADIASDNMRTITRKMEAMKRVMEQAEQAEFIASMGRRLGIGDQLSNLTPTQVLDFVMKKADSNPELVLDILDDANQQELFELDEAKHRNIIEMQSGHYYFMGTLLGQTEEDILLELRRRPDLLAEYKRRVSRAGARAAAGPTPKTTIAIDAMDLPDIGGSDNDEDEFKGPAALTTIQAAEFLRGAAKVMVPGENGDLVKLVDYKAGIGVFYGATNMGKSYADATEFLLKNPAMRQQIERIVAEYKHA